jgi:hypothetical protein
MYGSLRPPCARVVAGYGGGGMLLYVGGKFLVANCSVAVTSSVFVTNVASSAAPLFGTGGGVFINVAGADMESTSLVLSNVTALHNSAQGKARLGPGAWGAYSLQLTVGVGTAGEHPAKTPACVYVC